MLLLMNLMNNVVGISLPDRELTQGEGWKAKLALGKEALLVKAAVTQIQKRLLEVDRVVMDEESAEDIYNWMDEEIKNKAACPTAHESIWRY